MGRAHPISRRPKYNKKATLPPSKEDFFLSDFKPELKHQLFMGLEAASLKEELHHQLSWFLGLWTHAGSKPFALLGLLLANSLCRSWDLPVFIIL